MVRTKKELQQLLAIDINSVLDRNGNTILHWASKRGSLHVIKQALNRRANVNIKNIYGSCPLHEAVLHNYLDIVKELIPHQNNIDEMDVTGCTALHFASRHGYLDIVQLLIQCGASVYAQTLNGCTPLHCASGRGHVTVVFELLENGSDPLITDKYEKRTASDYAASDGIKNIILAWQNFPDIKEPSE